MITPMTKYSLLVYHREYDDFLEELRELGLVHILEKEMDAAISIKFRLLGSTRIFIATFLSAIFFWVSIASAPCVCLVF